MTQFLSTKNIQENNIEYDQQGQGREWSRRPACGGRGVQTLTYTD